MLLLMKRYLHVPRNWAEPFLHRTTISLFSLPIGKAPVAFLQVSYMLISCRQPSVKSLQTFNCLLKPYYLKRFATRFCFFHCKS